MQLVKYAPIGDIGKLRSSYLAAKIDPSVFVYDDGGMPTAGVQPRLQDKEGGVGAEDQPKIDNVCTWRPRELLEKYRESRHNVENQREYFHHITNYVARAESSSDANLVLSAYLDVDIKIDQIKLLKPSHNNVVMGCILQDTMGPGAAKLIAKRRIDALDGNVGSYSCLLNSNARLEQIREVNTLTAAVAEITRDKDNAKKRKVQEAAELALKRATKKKAAECTEERRRLEVMGHLVPLMEKFENGEKAVSSLETLSAKVLKEILKFYYNAKLKGMATIKKADMIDEVAKGLVVQPQHVVEVLPAGPPGAVG